MQLVGQLVVVGVPSVGQLNEMSVGVGMEVRWGGGEGGVREVGGVVRRWCVVCRMRLVWPVMGEDETDSFFSA